MIEQHSLTLFELLNNVRSKLKSAFSDTVWVVAEIMEYGNNRNGHCYLEFVEKDSESEKIIAKVRATIWANVAMSILPYFESVTGQPLHAGLKVLARVSVEMHEVYGLSLNIQDIDAQYTLGDIAQQRAKVIAQLEADGVIDMNKQLALPYVVQRVAVISSDTAAGWGDFKNQIDNNACGYSFVVELFPAVMQGDTASASIISAMEKVYARIDEFDAVAVIRGGGSKSDLSCFDQYDLAYYAAQFPLPVITGIGHERDNSVLDMVACYRLKTPTALASFLIDRAAAFDQLLMEKCGHVFDRAKQKIESQIQQIEHNSQRFVFAAKNSISRKYERMINVGMRGHNATRAYFDSRQNTLQVVVQRLKLTSKMQLMAADNSLSQIGLNLKTSVDKLFENESNRIMRLEILADKFDPKKIMERGYAIVTSGGKTVKSPADVAPGDDLSVRTQGGVIEVVVK